MTIRLTASQILNLWLFRRSQPLDTSLRIFEWWEWRRIPFNIGVGAAGGVSGAVCLVSGLIGEKLLGVPLGFPDSPIFVVFVVALYAIAANVCYTGGWLAEVLALKVWGHPVSEHFGQAAFAFGLPFAVALTLASIPLVAVAWVVFLATRHA